MLERIISGGQVGVDRGALDAALELGFPCGGICPKGRKSEDGKIPEKYPLVECESASYPVRTRINVIKGHGTLIISGENRLTGGSKLTRNLALENDRPCFATSYERIRGDYKRTLQKVWDWVMDNSISVLNVAGSRESKKKGIQEFTQRFISSLIRKSLDGK